MREEVIEGLRKMHDRNLHDFCLIWRWIFGGFTDRSTWNIKCLVWGYVVYCAGPLQWTTVISVSKEDRISLVHVWQFERTRWRKCNNQDGESVILGRGIIKNSTKVERKPHFKHKNTNLEHNQNIEPHFLVLTCSSAVLNWLTLCGFN